MPGCLAAAGFVRYMHFLKCLKTTGEYTEAVAKAAEENQDFVMGFISTKPSAWKGGPGSPGRSLSLKRGQPDFQAVLPY